MKLHLLSAIFLTALQAASCQRNNYYYHPNHDFTSSQQDQQTPSLFARILRNPENPATPTVPQHLPNATIAKPLEVEVVPTGVNATNYARSTNSSELVNLKGNEDDDDDDDDDDDNDDDDDDDDDLDIDIEDDDEEVVDSKNKDAKVTDNKQSRELEDIFGNKLKFENNRTVLAGQNKARDLGLLTIKAILLGPLIGLTIKGALIRGLLWAVGAWLLHLFFPSLLSSLGLGTGLVGFARQLQPDYAQMFTPYLVNMEKSIPPSLRTLARQYRQVLEPVIETIRSIPEGQCRYRAICEVASRVVKNANTMSTTLQRISATVYLNFGTEYSKAWLDGIVQSDCAQKYALCTESPLAMVANRLAEQLKVRAAN